MSSKRSPFVQHGVQSADNGPIAASGGVHSDDLTACRVVSNRCHTVQFVQIIDAERLADTIVGQHNDDSGGRIAGCSHAPIVARACSYSLLFRNICIFDTKLYIT